MGRAAHPPTVTRLGVVSDIHANLVALDAVLEDLPPVDGLVCAGDVVGYNPWPAACVDALRERDVPTVQGNHDRAVATGGVQWFNSMAVAGVDHAIDQLSADQIEWLRDLPTELTLHGDTVKVVHGHPEDPDRYTRPEAVTADILGAASVLVLGHTHLQFTETFEEGIVMNPGSVGQPRDGDPRAAYSVLDLDAMTVEERRVGYDVDRVEAAVAEEGLPAGIGTRLREGR